MLTLSLLVGGALADAAALSPCTTCRGPQWTWDEFPAFFHGSDPNGTAGGGFTQAALATIARFPIVTLEKWQGASITPYTWEEDAFVVAARQIKALSPHTAVVVWLDSVRVYEQDKRLNPNISGGCTTGNFRAGRFLDANPTPYLLLTEAGAPALEGMGCHIHNMADERSRRYWQAMCLNLTASGVIDGCGADASWMDGAQQAQQWGVSAAAGAAWGKGHRDMLRELSWPLLGSGITLGKEQQEAGDYVSGILAEECTPTNRTILILRNVSARAKAQGRRLIYECHYKPKDSPTGTTVLDSIAAFLIGVGEDQYFGLGAWDNRIAWTGNPKYGGANFSDHWVDGVFGRQLGAPLADAAYDTGTQTWSREFRSGTRVEFALQHPGQCCETSWPPKPCGHALPPCFGVGTIVWADRRSA